MELDGMKHVVTLIAFIVVTAASAIGQQTTATPTPAPKPAPTPAPLALKVGDAAPDFTLPNLKGEKVKLSDFRGKSNVVLAFYVFAFTGG